MIWCDSYNIVCSWRLLRLTTVDVTISIIFGELSRPTLKPKMKTIKFKLFFGWHCKDCSSLSSYWFALTFLPFCPFKHNNRSSLTYSTHLTNSCRTSFFKSSFINSERLCIGAFKWFHLQTGCNYMLRWVFNVPGLSSLSEYEQRCVFRIEIHPWSLRIVLCDLENTVMMKDRTVSLNLLWIFILMLKAKGDTG